MKKVLSLILSVLMVISSQTSVFALTDTYIFTDTVTNTYVGQTEANDMIKNLAFTDTGSSKYSESIAQMGAFDVVKGYGNTYQPNKNVTNQEAIAFIIRGLGREKNAQANAATLKQTNPGASYLDLWALGYLQEANNLGIITPNEYTDAINPDQSSLTDPAFRREAVAKREDVAKWIFLAENTLSPDEFPLKKDMQKVYTYSDWKDISLENLEYVETVTANGIMNSDTTKFNPKGGVPRGEMADILSNLDSIYFRQNNLTKKTGTVGGIKKNVDRTTGQYNAVDTVYIRNNLGKIDVIEKQFNSNNISPQLQAKDVPVYKNGKVYGLSALAEGDQIEYIVETVPNKNPNEYTCYYINVVNSKLADSTVFGKLDAVDKANSTVTVRDYKTNITTKYYTAEGVFGTDDLGNDYMIMDQKRYEVNKLPYGSGVNLHLSNNIVKDISYHGEQSLITEERGVVVENNPDFGYMVIFDNKGNKKTYNYDTGSLQTVKKLEHYQSEDSVGYIDQVFKSGNYNPVNSTIDRIDAGDIVFIRPMKDDPNYIESISASTNYNTKYGQIMSFVDNGEIVNMLVKFENGTSSMYQFPSDIVIMKQGVMVGPNDVVVGDYAKLLVNSAVISNGHVIETVKEIQLEADATYVTQIVKGQVAGVDNVQGTIQVQNAQSLQKNGWQNYKQINTYSLGNKNTDIFYRGKRVDLDYVNKYLKRGNNEVYIAIENGYSGEKVKRITIYDGRDTFVPFDEVVSASNDGSFVTSAAYTNYTTDDGTIVVRNGRLVTNQNIEPYDYAELSINGGNHAAVVNIDKKADTSGIMLSRGRIQSVDDGVTFTVQSMVTLTDNKWVITPIERTFNIDNQTVFIDNTGNVRNISEFITYTENSVYGEVFNIVSDGTTARFVIQAPYTKEVLRGEVYKVEGNDIYIKDATYLNQNTNTWTIISRTDNTAVAKTYPNTVILKDNSVSKPSKVQVGDYVNVYTTKLDYKKMTAGMDIDSYIVEVKK